MSASSSPPMLDTSNGRPPRLALDTLPDGGLDPLPPAAGETEFHVGRPDSPAKRRPSSGGEEGGIATGGWRADAADRPPIGLRGGRPLNGGAARVIGGGIPSGRLVVGHREKQRCGEGKGARRRARASVPQGGLRQADQPVQRGGPRPTAVAALTQRPKLPALAYRKRSRQSP